MPSRPRGTAAVKPAGSFSLASMSDEDLVRKAAAGIREAFELLVRRHQKPLVGYLHRLVGGREAASDLAQDVFIKVYLSMGSFDPRYRFTTWLYRIASNSAIDHLRRRQPKTCSMDAIAGDDGGRAERLEPAANWPTALEVLRLRELEERLEEAVAALPLSYRQLILLRHRHQCRYDEISRITRLPIGTVKNRIFRARELLRSRLADFLDVPGPP